MHHKIFAMELCILMRDEGLSRQLREIVRNHPRSVSFAEKWEMYRTVRKLLVAHINDVVKGCWDFFDENSKAQSDFNMWCEGLFTEEGARAVPSGTGDPRSDPRYMTFTMAFLLQASAPSVESLSLRCNIPEAKLWKRETFAYLLEHLGHLNFGSVKGDVVYVIPGADGWALTNEDLALEKFHYFRVVE
jgi:hypothetical protein